MRGWLRWRIRALVARRALALVVACVVVLVVTSVITTVVTPVAIAHGTGAAAQATAFTGRGFAAGALFCVVGSALCDLAYCACFAFHGLATLRGVAGLRVAAGWVAAKLVIARAVVRAWATIVVLWASIAAVASVITLIVAPATGCAHQRVDVVLV